MATSGHSRDPLRNIHVPETAIICCGTTLFFILTVVLCLDIATDIWTTVVYYLHEHLNLMGASILILAVAGIMSGVMYVLQMESKMLESKVSMATCLACNFPLQLGVIFARFIHTCNKCGAGCKPTENSKEHKDWTFAKLKMAQGTFQSAPMFIINVFAMYAYNTDHIAQYCSILASATSLVIGAVTHEYVRKGRLGGERIGPVQGTLIFLYTALIMIARLLTLSMFLLYYRGWLGAILILHFTLMVVYFFVVYREVWKVGFDKIFLHSFYCVLAYFPLHNEYRPDGEVMIFYAIFMIENVLMISLPHGIRPRAIISIIYGPNSDFYTIITIVVLVGSFLGLVLMGVYYFLFHRSAEFIRDTHFSCCTCLDCLEAHQTGAKPVPRDDHLEVVDQPQRVTHPGSGPPSYHSSFNMLAGKRQIGRSMEVLDYDDEDMEVKDPLTESDFDRSDYTDSSSDPPRPKPKPRYKPVPAPRRF